MDTFFPEEEHFNEAADQNNDACDDTTKNQGDNIFGIKYKENMFSEPCAITPDLPRQLEQEDIFSQVDQQCVSEQSTATPIAPKPLEFPPCRCYRIKCQKKYCECFRNGRKCTKKCICVDCCNQPLVTRLKVNVEEFWQVSYMFNSIGRTL